MSQDQTPVVEIERSNRFEPELSVRSYNSNISDLLPNDFPIIADDYGGLVIKQPDATREFAERLGLPDSTSRYIDRISYSGEKGTVGYIHIFFKDNTSVGVMEDVGAAVGRRIKSAGAVSIKTIDGDALTFKENGIRIYKGHNNHFDGMIAEARSEAVKFGEPVQMDFNGHKLTVTAESTRDGVWKSYETLQARDAELRAAPSFVDGNGQRIYKGSSRHFDGMVAEARSEAVKFGEPVQMDFNGHKLTVTAESTRDGVRKSYETLKARDAELRAAPSFVDGNGQRVYKGSSRHFDGMIAEARSEAVKFGEPVQMDFNGHKLTVTAESTRDGVWKSYEAARARAYAELEKPKFILKDGQITLANTYYRSSDENYAIAKRAAEKFGQPVLVSTYDGNGYPGPSLEVGATTTKEEFDRFANTSGLDRTAVSQVMPAPYRSAEPMIEYAIEDAQKKSLAEGRPVHLEFGDRTLVVDADADPAKLKAAYFADVAGQDAAQRDVYRDRVGKAFSTPGAIVYEPPGISIDKAVDNAVKMANEAGQDVVMKFNGHDLVVSPGENPKPVVAYYFAETSGLDRNAVATSDSYNRAVSLSEQSRLLDAQRNAILESARAYADESGYRAITAKQYEVGLAALSPEERAKFLGSSVTEQVHDPEIKKIHDKLFALGTEALTPEERKILIDVPTVTVPADAEMARLFEQIQALNQEHSALIKSMAADDGEFRRAMEQLNLRSEDGVWRYTSTPDMLSEQIVEAGLKERGIPVRIGSNNTFERGVPIYAQFDGDRAMASETFEARMAEITGGRNQPAQKPATDKPRSGDVGAPTPEAGNASGVTDSSGVAKDMPPANGPHGPTASLTTATEAAPKSGLQVGSSQPVEEMRATSQIKPAIAESLPGNMAEDAINKVVTRPGAAVPAAANDSATIHTPETKAPATLPPAANDDAPAPKARKPRAGTVTIGQTAEDIAADRAAFEAQLRAQEPAVKGRGVVGNADDAARPFMRDLSAADQAAIREAAQEAGEAAGRKLASRLGAKIPIIGGTAVVGGIVAYTIYNAQHAHEQGKLSTEHYNAILDASAVYSVTQMGSIFTGIAGEEAVEAELASKGVPEQYRYGTIRQAVVGLLSAGHDVSVAESQRRRDDGREAYALLPKNFTHEDDRLTNLGKLKSEIELAERAGMTDRAYSLRGEFNDSLEVYYKQGGNIGDIQQAVWHDPNTNQRLAVNSVVIMLPDDIQSARAVLKLSSDANAKQLMQTQLGLLEAEAVLRADPGNREARAQQAERMDSRDTLIARLTQDPNAYDAMLKDMQHAINMQDPAYAQREEARHIAALAPVEDKGLAIQNPELKRVAQLRQDAWAAGKRGDMDAYKEGEEAARRAALDYLQTGGSVDKASKEFGLFGVTVEGADIKGNGGTLNDLNKNSAAVRALDINRDGRISLTELAAGLHNYGVTMKDDTNRDFKISAEEFMEIVPPGARAPTAKSSGRG